MSLHTLDRPATPAAVVALEEAVVGVALVDPAAVVGIVPVEHLTGVRRLVYARVVTLHEAGRPCDPLTVDVLLHHGGHRDGRQAVSMARWIGERPAHPMVRWHADLLAAHHRRDRIGDAADRLAQASTVADPLLLVETVRAELSALLAEVGR